MLSASVFMFSANESKPVAIINCSQVVTLAGPARPRAGPELRELGIVSLGGLFVRDGLIERVGSMAEIEASIDSSTTVVDAGGRVILPGFVDGQVKILHGRALNLPQVAEAINAVTTRRGFEERSGTIRLMRHREPSKHVLSVENILYTLRRRGLRWTASTVARRLLKPVYAMIKDRA